MTVAGVGSSSSGSAFLPLHRSGGSGFSDTLRAHVRSDVASAMTREMSGAPATNATAQESALQQSLIGSRGALNASNAQRALAARMSTVQPGANPTEWGKTARDVGARYLPSDIADVFSRQMALESGGFDPDVISGKRVSSAGAEGIAQLMPSSYPNVDRTNPMESLDAAARTMRDNLAMFGGDVAKALAGYNAGAGRVQLAVQRRGADWMSDLPNETRVYLRELLGV